MTTILWVFESLQPVSGFEIEYVKLYDPIRFWVGLKNPLFTPISPEPVNVPPEGDRFKLIALSPTQSWGILGNVTVAVVSTLIVNESVYVQP